MDTNKTLSHQPRNVQELAKAAHEAWTIWDHRPAAKDGEDYARWQSEHKTAMNNLGASLMLFGLAGGADPRQARPVATKRVFEDDDRQHGPI